MQGIARISPAFFLGVVVLTGFASATAADTLDLACNSPDKAHDYRLFIDLASGLISSDAGQGARRWAAIITDKDVSWDEVYDSRIAHVAHHYVLDRATDTLHGTDMAGAGREIVTAVCAKLP
jgi:hypothetical protein